MRPLAALSAAVAFAAQAQSPVPAALPPASAASAAASAPTVTLVERAMQAAPSLDRFQALALQQVQVLQKTVEDIRAGAPAGPPSEARERAIAVKEDQLVDAHKVLATAQTANQLAHGLPAGVPPDRLDEVMPGVAESIVMLSNPMLPTCGAALSYRGIAQQVGWQDTLDDFLRAHGDALGAVGRIEVETLTFVPAPGNTVSTVKQRTVVGTAFAIDPSHVVTAGHVAALAWDLATKARRPQVSAVFFNTGGEYDVGCAKPDGAAQTVRLDGLQHVTYDGQARPQDKPLDYAVIDVAAGEPALRATLKIAAQPRLDPARLVMVVEYPARDLRVSVPLWKAMMSVPVAGGGLFPVPSIKRIAPGMVQLKCSNAAPVHLGHDASTLNQSSGAPILDVTTGEVVAIQVAGFRDAALGADNCNLGLLSDQPDYSVAAAVQATAPTPGSAP